MGRVTLTIGCGDLEGFCGEASWDGWTGEGGAAEQPTGSTQHRL